MAQTRDVQIRIKIEDGQAFVQIDRLGKGFIRATSAAEEFKKAIARQDPVLKGSVADFQRQIRALKTVRDNSAKTSAEFLKQTKAITALQQKQRALTADVTEFTKVNENQISSAGLAGATLVELGRTVSDLPFGINAITNNLSQLATLFITLTVKTQGTANAFKLLGKQLKGPLGIILLLQVLIAAVQQLFGNVKKAEDAIYNLNDSLEANAASVALAFNAFKTFTISGESAQRVAKVLNDNFKELNVEIDQFGDITADSVEQLKKFIEQSAKTAIAKNVIEQITELSKQQMLLRIELEKTEGDTDGFFTRTFKKLAKVGDPLFKGLVNFFSKSSTVIKRDLDDLSLEISEKFGMLSGPEFAKLFEELFKETKTGTSRRSRFLKQADLDFEKETQASAQRVRKIFAKTKEEQLELEIQGLRERAIIKQKEFEEDQNRRLKDFLASDASEKEKQNARKRVNDSIKESQTNLNNFLLQLDDEFSERLLRIQADRIQKHQENLQKFFVDTKFAQAALTKETTDSEIDAIEFTQQAEEAKYERQLINLNKLKVLNEQNGRSNMELNQKIVDLEAKHTQTKIILAKKEGEAKLAIANQVGNAIIGIAGEGTVVGKAVAVAMATMNTREAFTAALGMKPYSVFNIAQAGAVLAAGFAQVREILKTKIPGKGGSGAGGSTGPTTLEAPDFNIVGASAQSQLAQTIAGAEAQPVRAFVVGKDITTQQELDRNVTRTASFG